HGLNRSIRRKFNMPALTADINFSNTELFGFQSNLMYSKELFDRLRWYTKTVNQFHPDIIQFFLGIGITDAFIEQQTLLDIIQIFIWDSCWHMQGNFGCK